MNVNDERHPFGYCWICGDKEDHNGVPHGVATGDGRTRYDVVDEHVGLCAEPGSKNGWCDLPRPCPKHEGGQ
jgi:hypothetical protein